MEIFDIKFIEKLPEQLKSEILYVSIKFNTIAHLCPCGCNEEVITPISKKRGWRMLYDGKKISLDPSVGNWNLPCKSHYWIKNNEIHWCEKNKEIKNVKPKKNIFGWLKQFFC